MKHYICDGMIGWEKWNKPLEDKSTKMAEYLKDIYGFYLPPSEQKTLDLIERYWKKVSPRLIKKYHELNQKGKGQANFLKDIVYSKNPFLEMVKNNHNNCIVYHPIKISYENKDLN